MPVQLLELENLQTLTVFVVGKQDAGLSVRDLRKFPNLQGQLYIKNLQNVNDAMEAYDANLKSKEYIEELVLEWGKQTEGSQTEKAVLDMLQPSVNLKELTIDLYGGTSFPNWLGDSSFSNIVYIWISNCEYCVTLPPLGGLPSLKVLWIDGMAILDTIGLEFYGMAGSGSSSSLQPFPSLEHLEFHNMPNWKEWLPFEGETFPFPRLKILRLEKCPELRGYLPSHLSSIEEIQIDGCDHLLETPPTHHWLSSIKNVNIKGDLHSQGVTERTQWSLLGNDSPCLLQRVSISCCDTLMSVPQMILSSTCLQHLELNGIPSLTAFPAVGLPTSLQSLKMVGCENLPFLPPETWSDYTSLVTLELRNSCDALTSFPQCGFPALQRLRIYNCDSLSSFPLDGFPALQSLYIESCGRLESIFILESSSLHQSTLQSLIVDSCKALRSLPQGMNTLTTLEELILYNLPELELAFCEGACLPSKLQSLCIKSVRRIPLPVTEWGLQRLTALSKLRIGDHDIVNTLLKEHLLPISLLFLSITTNLSNMKSLQGNGLRYLSSLETLCFYGCSLLESLPEDTLPLSLETLVFANCPRLESLPGDRLPSSLKLLSIKECPLLEARYENQRREHWSNIAHIPVIKINDQVTI